MSNSTQDQPKATGASSTFTSRPNPDANGTHFSTIAAKAPEKPAGKALLAGMAGFVAIVIIGVASSHKGDLSFFTLLMAIVFGVGITWILQRFRLSDERLAAADTNFFAGHYAISTKYPQDAKVPPSTIDQLRIRNTTTGATASVSQLLVTPSVGGAVALTGAALRSHLDKQEDVYLQHLAATSFVVEVMTGGKSVILAGGLDQDTANGLLMAVDRAINQKPAGL